MTTQPALPSVPSIDFYRVSPADLPGMPGSVIRHVELDAVSGVRLWAMLYRSSGIDGRPVAVSGLVLGPPEDVQDPSPVIAWAHGTTGIADACAPSRAGMAGIDLAQLIELARLGCVVTATDYEGLGTDGIHPYLVGPSEARSIIDSIRAIDGIPSLRPDARSAIVGISQGGHAALWAAELLPSYAPELGVRGVIAASPPIDLRAIQEAAADPASGDLQGLARARIEPLMLVTAWHELFDAPIVGLLTQEAESITRALRELPPWEVPLPTEDPFVYDPRGLPEWQALLEANSPGHGQSGAPILVLAATQDEAIPPSTIEPGVARLRAAGSEVDLQWIEGDHTSTLMDPSGTAAAVGWLMAKLA